MKVAQKLVAISLTATLALSQTAAAASTGGGTVGVHGGVNYTYTNPSTSVSRSDSFTVSFGAIRVAAPRVKPAKLLPMSFKPPTASGGCSGISLNLGGFHFAGFDGLKDNLNAFMTAAAGYAFQLALDHLCPACKSIIDSMEEVANMINSLNFDGCKAAKNMIDTLHKKVADKAAVDSGAQNSFVNNMAEGMANVKKGVGDVQKFLDLDFASEAEFNATIYGTGSAVSAILHNGNFIRAVDNLRLMEIGSYPRAGKKRDEWVENNQVFFTSIMGDYIVDYQKQENGENEITPKPIGATYSPEQVLDLLLNNNAEEMASTAYAASKDGGKKDKPTALTAYTAKPNFKKAISDRIIYFGFYDVDSDKNSLKCDRGFKACLKDDINQILKDMIEKKSLKNLNPRHVQLISALPANAFEYLALKAVEALTVNKTDVTADEAYAKMVGTYLIADKMDKLFTVFIEFSKHLGYDANDDDGKEKTSTKLTEGMAMEFIPAVSKLRDKYLEIKHKSSDEFINEYKKLADEIKKEAKERNKKNATKLTGSSQ